jgi:hypothetical protein
MDMFKSEESMLRAIAIAVEGRIQFVRAQAGMAGRSRKDVLRSSALKEALDDINVFYMSDGKYTLANYATVQTLRMRDDGTWYKNVGAGIEEIPAGKVDDAVQALFSKLDPPHVSDEAIALAQKIFDKALD